MNAEHIQLLSDTSDWSLWLLVGVFALLLIAMVLYMIHLSHRAWLADEWVKATGSMDAAVLELLRFQDHQTDLSISRGMRQLGPGEIDQLIQEDR